MKTIHEVCMEGGGRFYHNEHVFSWLSQVFSDEGLSVRSEFPFQPDENGEYRVAITVKEKGK